MVLIVYRSGLVLAVGNCCLITAHLWQVCWHANTVPTPCLGVPFTNSSMIVYPWSMIVKTTAHVAASAQHASARLASFRHSCCTGTRPHRVPCCQQSHSASINAHTNPRIEIPTSAQLYKCVGRYHTAAASDHRMLLLSSPPHTTKN